eukprot:gnl/MRDRNA2_/MRDRNA2_90529_c0_seq1.p1 gnl/MRDRNA2_/MRDRNA2_90529_c0~~gnl/MRDRNA2_/MRDRNA2_90529_c0_seq1.p1  ORF type:complete len:432 (+),score=111.35 gnl/MRDRNA2_/MRDRNA2_90529_c0_seq1:103-1398(+)
MPDDPPDGGEKQEPDATPLDTETGKSKNDAMHIFNEVAKEVEAIPDENRATKTDAKPAVTETEESQSDAEKRGANNEESSGTTPAATETKKTQNNAGRSGTATSEESSGSEVERPLEITENQMKSIGKNTHELWVPTRFEDELKTDVPFPWQEVLEPKEGVNYGDVVPVLGNEDGKVLIARNVDPSVVKSEGPNGEAYHAVISTETDSKGWFYGTGWDRLDASREGGRARERITDKVRRRVWRFGVKEAKPQQGLWNRSMFPQLSKGFETENNLLGGKTVTEAVSEIPGDVAAAMSGMKDKARQLPADAASAMTGIKDKASGYAASTAERTTSAMAGMKDRASQLFSPFFGSRDQQESGMPPPAAAPLPAPGPGSSGMPPPAAAPLPVPGSSGMKAPGPTEDGKTTKEGTKEEDTKDEKAAGAKEDGKDTK